MTQQARPLIVSFVSGKGGVGKTMLAVAFARQLSRKGKTLLLDLDFFNRGLTGLLRRGNKICTLKKHGIFGSAPNGGVEEAWTLVRVADNLLHVAYPDLSQDQLRKLETSAVTELVNSLSEFLKYLTEQAGCEAIVLDCHGGPDNLSFAACQLSDYSLLVSEPDKITFYGTLHFVRQLDSSIQESAQAKSVASPDLRLVFNKVVPAFSIQYLTRFYNSNLRQLFGGHPLLAIFPMELYLTKEFERTPFLIDVYPYSLLARKTEVMVLDLLEDRKSLEADRLLPRVPWPSKLYARLSMGKTPWILNVNFAMAVIAIAAVAVYLFTISSKSPLLATCRRLGVQDDRAELMLQFQQHPDLVPGECRSDALSAQPDCFVGVLRRDGEKWRELSCDVMNRNPGCAEIKGTLEIGENYPFLSPDYYFSPYPYRYSVRYRGRQPWSVLARLETLRARKGLMGDVAAAVRQLETPSMWFRLMAGVSALLDEYGTFLAAAGAFWFLSAVILSWSRELDVSFTYHLRRGSQLMSSVAYLTALSLWALPLFFYGALSRDVDEVQTRVALVLLAIPLLLVATNQGWKASFNVWSEHRRGESVFRVLFVAYVVAVPILGRIVRPL